MILDGGTVGDSIALEISHNIILKKGDKGIFMCRRTSKELPSIDYYPENNPEKLEAVFNEQGFIKYFKDGINPEVWDWQFSLDSLAQVYGLMDLYTQLNYVDCYPGQSIFNDVTSSTESSARSSSLTEDNYPVTYNNSYRSSALNAIDTNLTSTLQNAQITASNGYKYFEFDLSLSDSINNIYFQQGVLKLKYDTLSFGSRIRLNNKVTISRQTVLLDANSYGNVSCNDSQRDMISIVLPPAHGSQPRNFYSLSTAPQPAVHLKIEILDCNHSSTILQYPTISTIAYYTLNPNDTLPTYGYDTLNLANDINYSGCGGPIYITSIVPDHVRAGTRDTVTITGGGFQSRRNNGNVFLKNADNGGQTYLHLDSIDYLTWNDNMIQFIVPSIVDTSNLNQKRSCPGSGFVKVKNNSGDSTSSLMDYLNIDYAITNSWIHDSLYSKYFVNLTPSDTSSLTGGFKFYPDSSITQYPMRQTVLERALSSWVCATTVNWSLAPERNDSDSIAVYNGISQIKFGYISDASVIAQTRQWVRYARAGCNSAWVKEIDLIINRDLTFFADTNPTVDVPSGYFDLYQILLHELGHGHSLMHVNDPNEVMWWATTNLGIPASNRRILLYNDYEAINGGTYVTTKSRTFNVANCQNGTSLLTSGSTNCTNVIGIFDVENSITDLTIFPNPASSELNIRLNAEKPGKIQFKIYDIVGKELYCQSESILSRNYGKTLSVNSLPSGIYLIQISIGNSKFVSKFIKD